MLLIHHLLEDGSSIHSWHIVVLERRHERHRTRGNDKVVGINVGDLLCLRVFDSYSTTLEEVPYRRMEQNAVVVVAGKCTCDIKTTHTTEMLLLFKEEELVRLHIELTTDAAIVVDHYVVYTEGIQLLSARKAGRTRSDYGHLRLVYLYFAGLGICSLRKEILREFAYLPHIVDRRNADAAYTSVDKHLACSAFSYAAFKTARFSVDAMAVYRKTSLMKRRSNGVSSTA